MNPCWVLLLAGIFFMNNTQASTNPLECYRWKNRLIVASVPKKQDREELAVALRLSHQKLTERDLIVIDISSEQIQIPGTVRLGEKETKNLKERFGLDIEKSRSLFLLIGKDGGVKDHHLGMLNLDKWFDLIDSMPMSQREANSNSLR